jgi:hypothetical protein
MLEAVREHDLYDLVMVLPSKEKLYLRLSKHIWNYSTTDHFLLFHRKLFGFL